MTNKWLIFTLFLAVMLFDGIIFPAFFGLREGFLTIIFLVAILLFCEINTQGLIFGIILSGIAALANIILVIYQIIKDGK